MAVTPVSLGPSLRAWSLAGITHILCDGPLDEAAAVGGQSRLTDSDAVDSRNAPASRTGSRGDSNDLALRDAGSAAPESTLQGLPAQAPSPGVSGRGAPPTAFQKSPAARGTAAIAGASTAGPETDSQPRAASGAMLRFASRPSDHADPAAWPEPWQSWFARTTPAPVLWTYHELGADLTGIGHSVDRSAFFKKLIGELGLPKGSSVFWPSAMPVAHNGEEAVLKAHPALFSAGLFRLAPRFVIVFGETALDDIGLAGSIRPFRQEMVDGTLLLCLPEIGVLLQNQGQRASSVSLLRTVLGSGR